MVEQAGVRFENLRDPWQTELRVEIAHRFGNRIVRIRSAGSDRTFGTADDFTVVEYQGTFFRAMQSRIEKALQAASAFPSDEAQLRWFLASSGIDLPEARDPWGQAYYLEFRTEARFSDRYRLYTYAEYEGIPETRQQAIPTKYLFNVLLIRSPGEDRIRGTYDEATVASFSRMTEEENAPQAPVARRELPAGNIAGKGTIAGVVTDPIGAVIPAALVTLDNTYTTQTDESGRYYFSGVPPGRYTVRFSSPGFRVTEVASVPVQPDHVTRLDTVLTLGSITEQVSVMAEATVVNTTSSQSVAVVPGLEATSTPLVREYFPETLLWNPELVTDSTGRVALEFPLADSITSWHVAVVGSTVDGRIGEGSADIKAFQPFFADLDSPQTLTAGDEISLPAPIRNYTDKEQMVAVELNTPLPLAAAGPTKQTARLAA